MLVLQIGAGTALPGIVADKLGASVILSDGDGLKDCINNCKRSCEMNNCHNIKVIGITWGEVGPDLLNLPKIDIILGSDCFYDTKGNNKKYINYSTGVILYNMLF